MLIKTIDFPLAVLQAQREGRLVIFAGAGVSMASPSNLPSFAGLAKRIGAGTQSHDSDGDPEDRYLGRLYDDGHGVQVHRVASGILLDPTSKPTELHSLILKIFGSKSPVRLVTTNFDIHFSTAANELGLVNLNTFIAPALPLGDNFDGIVYLHGAASSPRSMVLTDVDFGRAYLTYGWASRFLFQLFSTYTVLFVGYSHTDVVMEYLARGLPPQCQSKRFAFSQMEGGVGRWKAYGTTELLYQKREGENEHSAITESFCEWVDESQRGLLARSERIRSIVEAPPPLEGEDADYLKYTLTDFDSARQFAKYTKDPAYIDWLERHGFLKSLFDARATLTRTEGVFLRWIASEMLLPHSQEVLALVQRNAKTLHADFCWSIHSVLAYQKRESAVDAIFHTWVSILLSQPHTSLSRQDWVLLLSTAIP